MHLRKLIDQSRGLHRTTTATSDKPSYHVPQTFGIEATRRGCREVPYCTQSTPDGQVRLSVNNLGDVSVWNHTTGRLLHVFHTHTPTEATEIQYSAFTIIDDPSWGGFYCAYIAAANVIRLWTLPDFHHVSTVTLSHPVQQKNGRDDWKIASIHIVTYPRVDKDADGNVSTTLVPLLFVLNSDLTYTTYGIVQHTLYTKNDQTPQNKVTSSSILKTCPPSRCAHELLGLDLSPDHVGADKFVWYEWACLEACVGRLSDIAQLQQGLSSKAAIKHLAPKYFQDTGKLPSNWLDDGKDKFIIKEPTCDAYHIARTSTIEHAELSADMARNVPTRLIALNPETQDLHILPSPFLSSPMAQKLMVSSFWHDQMEGNVIVIPDDHDSNQPGDVIQLPATTVETAIRAHKKYWPKPNIPSTSSSSKRKSQPTTPIVHEFLCETIQSINVMGLVRALRPSPSHGAPTYEFSKISEIEMAVNKDGNKDYIMTKCESHIVVHRYVNPFLGWVHDRTWYSDMLIGRAHPGTSLVWPYSPEGRAYSTVEIHATMLSCDRSIMFVVFQHALSNNPEIKKYQCRAFFLDDNVNTPCNMNDIWQPGTSDLIRRKKLNQSENDALPPKPARKPQDPIDFDTWTPLVSSVHEVLFHPRLRHIFAIYDDFERTISIWDVLKGCCVDMFMLHDCAQLMNMAAFDNFASLLESESKRLVATTSTAKADEEMPIITANTLWRRAQDLAMSRAGFEGDGVGAVMDLDEEVAFDNELMLVGFFCEGDVIIAELGSGDMIYYRLAYNQDEMCYGGTSKDTLKRILEKDGDKPLSFSMIQSLLQTTRNFGTSMSNRMFGPQEQHMLTEFNEVEIQNLTSPLTVRIDNNHIQCASFMPRQYSTMHLINASDKHMTTAPPPLREVICKHLPKTMQEASSRAQEFIRHLIHGDCRLSQTRYMGAEFAAKLYDFMEACLARQKIMNETLVHLDITGRIPSPRQVDAPPVQEMVVEPELNLDVSNLQIPTPVGEPTTTTKKRSRPSISTEHVGSLVERSILPQWMTTTDTTGFYRPSVGDEVILVKELFEAYVMRTPLFKKKAVRERFINQLGDLTILQMVVTQVWASRRVPQPTDATLDHQQPQCYFDYVTAPHFNLVLESNDCKLCIPFEVDSGEEFLIPKARFDKSMSREWQYGDKIFAWWKTDAKNGQWYPGQVVNIQPEWRNTPCRSISVTWDGFVTSNTMHPWELFDTPHDEEQLPSPSHIPTIPHVRQPQQIDPTQWEAMSAGCFVQSTGRDKFYHTYPSLNLLQSNIYHTMEAFDTSIGTYLSTLNMVLDRVSDDQVVMFVEAIQEALLPFTLPTDKDMMPPLAKRRQLELNVMEV